MSDELCQVCGHPKHSHGTHYGDHTECWDCLTDPMPAAPRDEARDLDPILRATAHWPPLTDDQLQMLAAEGALGSIAAVEILRLLAAAPRADQPEPTRREELFAAIGEELDHAYEKHGADQWGRHEFYAILLEEVDELWDAIRGDLSQEEVEAELTQVAAMCFRYFETGDRYGRGTERVLAAARAPGREP